MNSTTINSPDYTTKEYEDWDLVLNNATNKIRIAIDGDTNVGIATKLASHNWRNKSMKALIDGGANGGIVGTEDSRLLNSIFTHGKRINVTSLSVSYRYGTVVVELKVN